MEPPRHTILFVDDEKNILNSLKRLLRKEDYHLLTASSGEEGLKILAENEVHLVITDLRMPKMNGIEFLARLRVDYPDLIRIILTGYTDVDTLIESINKGHIYKFFLKPWDDHDLKMEIRKALEQYDLMAANKRLYEKAIKQNEEPKTIDENL
jgi:DNA-binding NtrC family response regulator